MRLVYSHVRRTTQRIGLSLSLILALLALLIYAASPGYTANPLNDGGTDATNPAVRITAPTENPSFSTGADALTLRGIATDNVGVTQVTCASSPSGNCSAAGTLNWTASVTGLQPGTNVVTVSARDAAGNVGTRSLTVVYTPPSDCGGGTSVAYRVMGGPPLHPNGTIIKTSNSPTLYLLQNGQRRLIATQGLLEVLYTNGGFELKDVITVADDELNRYPVGPVVDSTLPSNGRSQPDGRLIRRPGGAEISIVTNGGNRSPFVSEGAFQALGYLYCNVVEVIDYDAYPADLPADAFTLLVVTSVEPSSVQTADWGDSVTYTITVRNALGDPISGASVVARDNLRGGGTFSADSPTDGNGQTTYTTTVQTGTPNGVCDIIFFAEKADYTTSNAVARQVQVSHTPTGPALTITSVEPAALQVRDWGGSVTYTITVRDGNGDPVSGATVVGVDNLRGTNFTTAPNTTDSNGQVTYVTTVPDGRADGVYTISFVAIKEGFTDSPSVTRQVQVVHVVTPAFVVTNTNNSGPGSLRQAILDSNNAPGKQIISFDIPGSGVRTIALTSPLPRITDPVVIDGYTQPGAEPNTLPAGNNAVLRIELNGAGVSSFDANGLYITAGDSEVRGLIINRFFGPFFGAGIVLAENGGNLIEGNFIGVNAAGDAALSNLRGVMVFSPGNTVGGTDPAARNVISGNEIGVLISGVGATGNLVLGNHIGTDAAGAAALGNSLGVFIIEGASDNTVGGAEAGARNVISGNQTAGIYINPKAKRNTVSGNYIGTNAAGAAAVGNGNGVIIDGSTDNTVGGTSPAARNVISGNVGQGVRVTGNTLIEVVATGNVIQGNYIGTDAGGAAALGNGTDGVSLELSASDNTVGGTEPGAGNVIAFNDTGVAVKSGSGNAVLSNSIFSNRGLGIRLGPGANNNQAPPVLTDVVSAGEGTTIQGSLDSAPGGAFTIQFFSSPECDPSGRGEGKTFIGALTVTTDGGGHADFTITVPAVVAAGHVVTATATDQGNNTSEFSQCEVTVAAPSVLQFSSAQYSVSERGGSATITVVRTGGLAGAVSVAFATSDGTAEAGADYTPAAGVLAFGDGESSKTFTVTILDDFSEEEDETVNLTLSDPTAGALLGAQGTAVLTIVDDDGATAGLQFYPLPRPIRYLDTRPASSACSTPGSPIPGGTSLTLQMVGTCSGVTIPASARAVVGNATVVSPAAAGFATLYPSDVERPVTSNINYVAGQVVANSFTVSLSEVGSLDIFAFSETHFVVDITGYYAPPGEGGLYYHPLPRPVRLLDTRPGQTACFAPGAPIQGGASRTQTARVTCGGVVIPDDAVALVGNATVVNTTPAAGSGFVTLYPSGSERPVASNINYVPGQIVPNSFTVSLGPAGSFEIFALTQTHVVVDVTGYYSASAAADPNGMEGLLYFGLASPARLLDTRPGAEACSAPGAPLAGGAEFAQQATGTCAGQTIPDDARAVVGNATVVNSGFPDSGFVTLYPSGEERPTVSNLNYVAGQVVANSFIVGLGPDGRFVIFPLTTTHFIADVSGYFAPQ